MKVAHTRLKLAGRQFGRLSVLRGAERAGKSGHRYWWASCTCGREVMVLGSDLARGRIGSCGCLRRELALGRRAVDGRFKLPLAAAP
jgi:hypothetical protein